MEQGNYARQLLMQLNQQRSKGYLCDVIIVVENALFQAHKNILAASSSYFKSLVLHDNLISLDTEMVSPSVFRQVLDFIYTGRLPASDSISDRGLSVLLTAASYLQLSDLAALCHKRLKSSSSCKTVPSSSTTTYPTPHPQCLSCNPLRVTRSPHSVSGKAERSQKWEGRQKEDVSEEDSFISQSVSLSPSAADKLGDGVVGAGCGLGLDLSRKSPTGSAVTEEGSPSGLQQGSPTHSGSTNNSALSDDMTTSCTSALSTPGEEHSGQGKRQESQQKAAPKRPWSGSEGSLEMAFSGQGKRQRGVGRGVMTCREDGASPESEDQEKDGEGEAVLEDQGPGGSGAGGQSESEGGEMNKNQNANYIYRQPQAGLLGPALGEDLYVCVPCGKGFPSAEGLNVHVDAHTAEELKLEDVNGVGVLKEEDQDVDRENLPLRSIKEEPDHVPPRHICSVCGKTCADLALLKEHEKSHWLTRPFPCNICGKLFTQRGTMTRHMRSHLGLKPFACEECGMRFTRQYRLTEHMRVHSGEKPYGCQLCGGKFTQQRNLISHLKMHTSPP